MTDRVDAVWCHGRTVDHNRRIMRAVRRVMSNALAPGTTDIVLLMRRTVMVQGYY